MGLRLNDISDAASRRALDDESEWLAELLAASGSRDAEYLGRLAKAQFEVAAHTYQLQGARSEVVAGFRASAAAWLEHYETVGAPIANETRNVWEFLRALDLVVAFGSREDRRRIGSINKSKYLHPVREANVAVGLVVSLIQGVCLSDSLQGIDPVITTVRHGTTPEHARRTLTPIIGGLTALFSRDQAAFQRAVAEAVEAHHIEARRGEYRLLAEGFVCLDALMLLRLGEEHGVYAALDSPYLPAALLEPGG